MIKKAIFILMACSAQLKASAQSVDDKADLSKMDDAPEWFAGAGFGGMVYFGDHDKQLKFGKRIAPNFEFYGGRWINQHIGVRLGLNGFKVKGLTQNGSHSTGEIFDPARSLEKQAFNYFYIHGDALFQLSNYLHGINAERLYNVMPYAGIGLMVTTDVPKKTKFSPNLGVLQTLRLTDRMSFTCDVRANIVSDDFDGEKGGHGLDAILISKVGLKYVLRAK